MPSPTASPAVSAGGSSGRRSSSPSPSRSSSSTRRPRPISSIPTTSPTPPSISPRRRSSPSPWRSSSSPARSTCRSPRSSPCPRSPWGRRRPPALGPAPLIVIGIAVGIAAGAFNGFVVTWFRIPSIVVTIGTMSLFRGIAYVVLGDQAYRHYPAGFAYFGQGYVWWVVSFEFVLFLVVRRRLRRRAPPHLLRPAHLCHRQQSGRGAVLRRARRPHPLPAVRADRH